MAQSQSPSAAVVIGEVSEGTEPFGAVLRLAKANRRYLGFLPDAGFADRSRKGTLLAATEGDAILGYVLYDLPSDRVKIVHLCVDGSRRHTGVARALVEHVSARHQDRRGLEVSCRRDFPANALWSQLGFRPVAERSGRSNAGHPLTVWLLPHAHEDLFTLAEERRDIAVIDNNIFKDLISDRPQGRAARHLLDDWVAEVVELCATDELLHEINDCDVRSLRAEMQRHASAYRTLSVPRSAWQDIVAIVARLAPAAGAADHRHVARAAAANATYFVTRDAKLLRGSDRLRDELRIVVMRPETLIVALDRLRSAGDYEPAALHATSVVAVSAGEIHQDAFVSAFLNYGASERAADLRDILGPALASPSENETQAFRSADGQLLGALIYAATAECIEVKLVRSGAADHIGRAIARQLAFLPRQVAASRGAANVVITDPRPSASVARLLPDEGYDHDEHGRWVCHVQRGLYDMGSLTAATLSEQTPTAAAALERRRWPMKVTGAGLPTFMIAINPSWAAQLFDTNLASATLFGRGLDLGLSREHVYYRSPGWPGGIAHPARILWYVTGGAPGHAVGHVRAVSQLVEVVVGRPLTLYQRFARLGVWSEQQVCQAADANNNVMALRFVDTEVLDRPLDLATVRDVFEESGSAFRAPQSPSSVAEHMFCLLYERGSAYAS